MDRTAVKSSNIASIGYDPATRTMEIAFKGGKSGESVYQHMNVPQAVYDALMAADSKGSHYAAHVRGKFDFAKV